MSAFRFIDLARGLTAAIAIALAAVLASEAPAAEGPPLPPAEFKPLPVGTRLEYDNHTEIVAKSDGFMTVFKKQVGEVTSWSSAHALFAESADNLYVRATGGARVEYELDDKNKKKLEALWPLAVGKETRYQMHELTSGPTPPQEWTIALKVSNTEVVNVAATDYQTYVIEERAESDGGMAFRGRKWYDPETGLIVQATRTWTKVRPILGVAGYYKVPYFAEGDEDNFTLRQVDFPPGTAPVAVAAAQGTPTAGKPATATDKPHVAEVEPANRPAKDALQATSEVMVSVAEIAKLKQEAERAKQEGELQRLKREAELTRLKLETERAKQEAEIARLGLEAERARRETSATRQAATAQNQAAEEERLWSSIRNARTAPPLEDYLARYPNGRFRGEVETRLVAIKKFAAVEGVEFGNYYALVIGIDNYNHLPKLNTAVTDAKAVAEVLQDSYGFQVKLLLNANRAQIIDTLDLFRETLGRKDNLLIYYAGHGWLDQEADRGYWLPADAHSNRRTNWVSNETVTDTLRTVRAKHVMVVADSCYSGTLTRGASVALRSGDYWKRMAEKFARVALVSGGLEPVADTGGGGHSPFAKAFTDALRANDAVIDGIQLFNEVRRPVMVATRQTPQYSDVRNAGHDGGDFLFVRKK